MPDEKKGLIATLKDRWAKFRAGSKRPTRAEPTRPPTTTGRRVVPQMNPQQRKATEKAREHQRRQRRPRR